ncbi:MAG: crosslink repair DNA glycosylase YcaQ family protein [Actinomycetota bacterium]|nr:crosslink repair DNA glycosylase YcaQ family protein [Actinomycetota bacterium]MDG1489281.1 crosslink repair DNA glycosylase YcaQ family protein [Actinomycetota bacterium]MDG2120475.1 crosslink repair DNA glycosylase YcaQ family protein [Actinomycetota bacterium]
MDLSAEQARKIALISQGMASSISNKPNSNAFKRTLDSLGVIQIDAVNAVARSHLLVLRSRLGGTHEHLEKLLRQQTYKNHVLAEYWGHEASFLPTSDWPLYKWRMRRAAKGEIWKGIRNFANEKPGYIKQILNELTKRGPSKASDFKRGGPKSSWWGWSDSKLALEWLFWIGEITVANRVNFTRYYDLPQNIFPEKICTSEPEESTAHKTLILNAARYLGVATADDIVDYHRLPKKLAKLRLQELEEDRQLSKVAIEGWDEDAYILTKLDNAEHPTRTSLLSPFDPIVWFRPRAKRLFNFEYKLEIYRPKSKRLFGYYVMPFLYDNMLRARLDIKANRSINTLEILGSFSEPKLMNKLAVQALWQELKILADACGLASISVSHNGDLAPALHKLAQSK